MRCLPLFRPSNSSAKAELAAMGQAIGEALVISDMTAVVGHHRRSQLAAVDPQSGGTQRNDVHTEHMSNGDATCASL
jgi:hypothetical protein